MIVLGQRKIREPVAQGVLVTPVTDQLVKGDEIRWGAEAVDARSADRTSSGDCTQDFGRQRYLAWNDTKRCWIATF